MDSYQNEASGQGGESTVPTEKKVRKRNVTFSDKTVEEEEEPTGSKPEVSSKSKMANGILSESNNTSPTKAPLPTRLPPDGEENVTDVEDNILDDDGNNPDTKAGSDSATASPPEGEEPAAASPPDGDASGSRRNSVDSSATTCSNNNNNWNDEMDMDVDEEGLEEGEGEGEEGDYYDDYEYDPYSHEWVPKIKEPASDEDSEEALLIPKEERARSLSTIAQALVESAIKNNEAYVKEQEMQRGDGKDLSFFDEFILCCGGCRRLCRLEDMPPHLQFNKYIHSGYRSTQDTWGCVLSIMYLHNETLNILTHLLPIIYVVLYWRTMFPWEDIEGNIFLNILGWSHIVASIAPWIGSVFYHLMMSHNSGPQFYQFLLQIDMFGIWLTECFGALTNLSAATWCLPETVKNYIVGAYGMAAVFGLQKALTAWTPISRRMCFAPVFISRILGIALRLSSWGGGEPSVLMHVFLQDIISVGGGVIGVIRIPEKWFPGRLDLWFNSHHIMHIMVVIAVVHMNLATNGDIRWIINNYNNSSSCPVN